MLQPDGKIHIHNEEITPLKPWRACGGGRRGWQAHRALLPAGTAAGVHTWRLVECPAMHRGWLSP